MSLFSWDINYCILRYNLSTGNIGLSLNTVTTSSLLKISSARVSKFAKDVFGK